MTLNYPDDSLQNAIEPDAWWIEDEDSPYRRGRLVRSFLPHTDQNPFEVVPAGRREPTLHNQAHLVIKPIDIRSVHRYPNLPVAGVGLKKGEILTAYRAKKRPAVIVSSGGRKVTNALTREKPKWQTAPTLLVAPSYGVDEGAKRSGFNPAFVERVRRCEYPQFIWEMLPLSSSTSESLIRLDHIQPVGRSEDSVVITKFCLSESALTYLDSWIEWLITGNLDPESDFGFFKEELLKIDYKYQ